MDTCKENPGIVKSTTFYAAHIMPSWAVTKAMPLHLTVFELLLLRGAPLKTIMKFCHDFHPSEINLPPLEEDISLLLLVMMATVRPTGVLQWLVKNFPNRCKCSSDPDSLFRRLLLEQGCSIDDVKAVHGIHPITKSLVTWVVETPAVPHSMRDFVLNHRPTGMTTLETIIASGECIVDASQMYLYLDSLRKLPLRYENLILHRFQWCEIAWTQLMGLLADSLRGIKHLSLVFGQAAVTYENLRIFQKGLGRVLPTCALESLDLCFSLKAPPIVTKGNWSYWARRGGFRIYPQRLFCQELFDVSSLVSSIIRSSQKLKKLWIRDGLVGSEVAAFLKENSSLRFLVIESTFDMVAEESFVSAVRNHPSLLYADIRNPSHKCTKDQLYLPTQTIKPSLRRNRTDMTKSEFVDLIGCPDGRFGLSQMNAQFEMLRDNVGVWCNIGAVTVAPTPVATGKRKREELTTLAGKKTLPTVTPH